MYSATESSYRRITARLRSENAELLGHHPRSGVPEGEFSRLRNEFKSYLAAENRIELFLPLQHPDLTRFLDGAPSQGEDDIVPDYSKIDQPIMHEGWHIGEYLKLRPTIANNKPELAPGTYP